MSFRLTFNKPAIAQFFGNDSASAVRVKIENNAAFFLPISGPSPTKDVLPINLRTRGGGESYVEGTRSKELQHALTNEISNYFTLEQKPDGWFEAVAWDSPGTPGRLVPHVRGWMPMTDAGTVRETRVDHNTFKGLVDLLKQSLEVISKNEPRVGRPSKEVAQAKETIALFKDVVREIQGDLDPRVEQAQQLLKQALRQRDFRYMKSLSSEDDTVHYEKAFG